MPAEDNSYVALGLSTDDKMGGDSVMACSANKVGNSINPFLPDCKATFSWIFYIFYAIFKFLRPEHNCYAKFTSYST